MPYGFTEPRIYVVSTVPTATAGPSMNLTKEHNFVKGRTNCTKIENNYEQVGLTLIKLILCYADIGKSL
jgi:hypothetical protein